MPLDVLGFRVMIKPDKFETTHKVEGTEIELVVVTDEKLGKQHMDTGVIVGVGPLAWKDYNKKYSFQKPWANVGDYVQYCKYSGKWVIDAETKEEFIVVDDLDILCKIKKVK